MRSVQVIEQSGGNVTRANNVIGIDESGNVTGAGEFALVTVRCPRDTGEQLAELLVDNDLFPWRGKSQTLAQSTSLSERRERVQGLIGALSQTDISWRGAVGYSAQSIHEKAAAICTLSKKTITGDDDFGGDSVLIPDGSAEMYGANQEHLRTQAAQIFDGPFQSHFGEVYATGLVKADLTYPEVTTADYIAGYLREKLQEGYTAESLPSNVVRFQKGWREPNGGPLPYYTIKGVSGAYGNTAQTRAAAWIKGRHPDGDDHDISSQWPNTVRMLESDMLQQYLLDRVTP